ncbi:MAG: type II secretion system protein [Candidatus Gracilibacteria bacterium]|nr:type II secretion system protein [Candidatus Gracilibacteria bacterium]
MKIKNKNKAFTLVELIVVITILAILGTIAFINLQGYSIGARDSKRLSDVNNLMKKVGIEQSKGTPLSSLINTTKTNSSLTIGGQAGTSIQGTANFQTLKEEGNNFKDPITNSDYVLSYSAGGTGTGAYKFTQVASVNEELNQAIVKGNYYLIDVNNDSPSIVTNDNDSFVTDGGVNLPYLLAENSGNSGTLFEKLITYLQTSGLGIDPYIFINTLVEYNGKLYFSDSNYAFYSIDINSNVVKINDYTQGKPIVFNNKLFFYWNDINNTSNNYFSYTDGNSITDINMNIINDSRDTYLFIINYKIFNNKLYFWGNDYSSVGSELYSIDTLNNLSVLDINPSGDGIAYDTSTFGIHNNKLYFWANDGSSIGDELFSLDTSNNLSVLDINPSGDGRPSWLMTSFVEFNSNLYFNANNGVIGEELFYLDSGDNLSNVDIESGINDSYPNNFNVYNNKLYFSGTSTANGIELYNIDNTNNIGYNEINPGVIFGTPYSSNPGYFSNFNNNMYFKATHSGYNNGCFILDMSNNLNLSTNPDFTNIIGKYENKLFFNNYNTSTLDYIDSSGNFNSIPDLNILVPM